MLGWEEAFDEEKARLERERFRGEERRGEVENWKLGRRRVTH